MSRVRTIGYELGIGNSSLEVADQGAGSSPTIVAGGRTGKALRCVAGTGTFRPFGGVSTTGAENALNRTYFLRQYIMVEGSFPATSATIISDYGATGSVAIKLTSTGTLQLWNITGAAQIGSDSPAIALGQWYRVDLSWLFGTGSVDTAEGRLEGSVFASGTGLALSDAAPTGFNNGWVTAPGVNGATIWFDDVALFDSQGATENSYPGAGKVALLVPTGDNARDANWFEGTSATATLWDAVNNTPPLGVAHPSTNGTFRQVVNAASDLTGNYDAQLTTYADAGIADIDTVVAVQALFAFGCDSTTSTLGACQFVSNPVGPAEASVNFSPGAIAGTWSSNWFGQWLPGIVGDIADRVVAPVIRIGKRNASTRAALCSFMGAYVEYTPGTAVVAVDGVNITPGSGQPVATDQIDDIAFERMKLMQGDDGFNDGSMSRANPLWIEDRKNRRLMERILMELKTLRRNLEV